MSVSDLVKMVAIFAFAIGVSYMLAKAGEPQSVWFWQSLFGVNF